MTESASWYAGDVATFGDRMAGAREAAGLSQEELAKRLGVRLTSIQSWEDDSAEPRANRLQMMAGMLNVSIRWLLTGEGEGVDAPGVSEPVSVDTQDMLKEIARMRTEMLSLANQMGQMEKRLRVILRNKG